MPRVATSNVIAPPPVTNCDRKAAILRIEKGKPVAREVVERGYTGLSLGRNTEFASKLPRETLKKGVNLKWKMLRRVQNWLYGDRIGICQRRIPLGRGGVGDKVGVTVNAGAGTGHFDGLACCENVHSCPICAPRIMSRRAVEVKTAMDAHWTAGSSENLHNEQGGGGMCVMFTFTFPHTKNDPLRPMMLKFAKALKQFKSGSFSQQLRKELHTVGTIKALETTYGQNGWHLHCHEVLFIDRKYGFPVGVDKFGKVVMRYPALVSLEITLRERWRVICERNGLGTINEHGFTIVPIHSSDYITKSATHNWGGEKELTGNRTKQGRQGGMTPWQLIENGLSVLWLEYHNAMKGHHALRWSRGLKKHFGIKEIDVNEPIEGEIKIGELSGEEYELLNRTHSEGTFIELCLENGFEYARQLTFYGLTSSPDPSDSPPE